MSSMTRFNAKKWLPSAILLLLAPNIGCMTEEEAAAAEAADVAVTSQALLTVAPESLCTNLTFNGKSYFFCAIPHVRDVARALCKNVGADLVSIESAAENTFVAQNTGVVAWIGANDRLVEGTWRWESTGVAFWQGTSSGSTIGNQYSKWYSNQPDPASTVLKDCGSTDVTGQWAAQLCTLSLPYVCEEFSAADCNAAVLGKAKAAVAPGAEILNPLVQADLLRCATPDLTLCEAAFHGAVRFDTYIATRQAVAGTITPSKMIAVKQDRARKANILARNNSSWVTSYCAGDTDGDLVPNNLDQCAGTPGLTPTTDTGCTQSTLPAGPTTAAFQKAMGAVGIINDRNCIGKPAPMAPINLRGDGGGLILWSDAQPASTCERWYELKISVRTSGGASVTDHFAVRRRESDADITNTYGQRTTLCQDAERGTLGAQCLTLAYPSNQTAFAPAPWPWWTQGAGDTVNIGMRAFDGNGNRSGWTYFSRKMP